MIKVNTNIDTAVHTVGVTDDVADVREGDGKEDADCERSAEIEVEDQPADEDAAEGRTIEVESQRRDYSKYLNTERSQREQNLRYFLFGFRKSCADAVLSTRQNALVERYRSVRKCLR